MNARPFRGNALLVLLALTMVTGCQKYDVLIEKDQVAEQRWADLEAALQRRADLIPNLVNTVKAAAASEKEILSSVLEARAKATSIQLSGEDLQDPAKVAAFQQAQEQLSGALSRLLVVQEKYPELKSNENFRALQVQLEGTENRILRSREQYNAAVRDYNTELGKVGGSVVRRATGGTFKPREYFRASPASQTVPQVNF
jgi:LemA protein